MWNLKGSGCHSKITQTEQTSKHLKHVKAYVRSTCQFLVQCLQNLEFGEAQMLTCHDRPCVLWGTCFGHRLVSGWGGPPVLMCLFWTFKVGRARKHWFENETFHVKPHAWAEGYGGLGRTGPAQRNGAQGSVHMGRGVLEVGGLMRTPGKLGCNLRVTMDTTTHARSMHWSDIDNVAQSSL